jgi:hypothetical protein
MLYREIIAVCSQIHTKHINTLCGQKANAINLSYGKDNWLAFVRRRKIGLHKMPSVCFLIR